MLNQSRLERTRMTKPIPCYAVENIPPREGHNAARLYAELETCIERGKATLIESLTIPACDAKSWKVKAGQMWRIKCIEGPQVADMNVWNLNNTRERFYSSKTRQIHSTHLQIGDRLWSNFPYVRPLASITGDSIKYGFDEDGAGVHDVIGSRCDPYTHYLLSGETKNICCHSNLTRCAIRDGLTEDDVHDVLNVFMCTGFTKDTHQYFTKPSPVQVGDYIEFLAETDLLVSASCCPQGDVSTACAGSGVPKVYPLGVEIWQPEVGWLRREGWIPAKPSEYDGNHGLPQKCLIVPKRPH